MEDFAGLWFDKEAKETATSEEQYRCECECASFLKPMYCYAADTLEKLKSQNLVNYSNEIRLLRSKHIEYLNKNICNLNGGYVSLDASRPWIVYWITHALTLLHQPPIELYSRIVTTLNNMQNSYGGYGGGPGQISHGAPTYASVLSLCTIATPEALQSINRPAMYKFFLSLKNPCGGLEIHKNGEVDSRGTYTIICIARLLNILTPELSEGVAEYIAKCQTYEGGFGGEPYNEAHGGYNFCALATIMMLKSTHLIDVTAQENWLLRRQMKLEGGFQGRTNKLVDSCYSFWQGAAVAMCEMIRNGGSDVYDMEQYVKDESLPDHNEEPDSESEEVIIDVEDTDRIVKVTDTSGVLSFNQLALQRYILHCAQNLEGGGMRDKPSKAKDFYHSCYALSGLAVAQSARVAPRQSRDGPSTFRTAVTGEQGEDELPDIDTHWKGPQVYGDIDNLLEPTSVVFNIGLRSLHTSLTYFQSQPTGHETLLALAQQN